MIIAQAGGVLVPRSGLLWTRVKGLLNPTSSFLAGS